MLLQVPVQLRDSNSLAYLTITTKHLQHGALRKEVHEFCNEHSFHGHHEEELMAKVEELLSLHPSGQPVGTAAAVPAPDLDCVREAPGGISRLAFCLSAIYCTTSSPVLTIEEAWELANSLATNKTRLQHLDLSGCSIGDGIASVVAASLWSNRQLLSLDLSHNHISNSGSLALSQPLMQPNSPLRTLKLNGNMISDEGAVAFVPNSQLQQLEMADNNLSAEFVLSIQAQGNRTWWIHDIPRGRKVLCHHARIDRLTACTTCAVYSVYYQVVLVSVLVYKGVRYVGLRMYAH
jgi:hypothetical protein